MLEHVHGALAVSASDKLAYHLDLARTRLTEAEAMISRHRVDLAGTSLRALDDQLKSAALLVQTERLANPAAAVHLQDRLRQAVATDDQQLADLQGQVQSPAAAGAISQARQHANDALKLAEQPAASPTASPGGPGGHASPTHANGHASPSGSPAIAAA